MKIIGAYVLTDVRTGKFYVGSSGDVHKRFAKHFSTLRTNKHHCLPLQFLWNNNGRLLQTVFQTETREEAYVLEQNLLDGHTDSDKLLNICLQAKGGDTLTRHPKRVEIVEKIKAAITKRMMYLTPMEKKLLFGLPGSKNGMWGKTHTSEVKRILSLTHLGNTHSLGHKHTDEFRKQMSENAKKRIGEKNSFYGKSHSDTTKQRLSEWAKNRDYLPSNTRSVIINEVEYLSLSEAARQLQVTPALIVYRMKNKSGKYGSYYYKDERSTTIESHTGK